MRLLLKQDLFKLARLVFWVIKLEGRSENAVGGMSYDRVTLEPHVGRQLSRADTRAADC